ncbi:delta 9 acyl-lipid fatty acid desaturase [Agaricicola taiwanensis]|uniref:Delta 9 acyl-lipid fatty acid desaturase n=1 Tax=Agaricicola taiwanensis TaxID=591372 RepID=A0A8J2YFZ2_9RHOB|nr:acyl-CoA desaturase [Agaricicola taiwanensis]GGE32514.1 delta 9 acyl-lipid fatty acid desaturase [Agaricicola taiwanensis]
MTADTDHDHHDDIVYPAAIPFVLLHFAAFAAIWTGVTWEAVAICVALYVIRIFAIGAGYHRYFSHRSYQTGRVFQFILAFLAQSTAQKSVLWWAAKHRHHHLHSDTEHDVHSPRHTGFFYAHVGWIFAKNHDTTDLVKIADFAKYPELMFLHRFELLPAVITAIVCWLIAGWPGLVVGFVWSTVLVYHATFCINSLAHVHGKKRYVTGDDSRNNWLLAFFTMGEGWHNNHHAYQSSVRQGFKWWEIDPTYYILKALSWIGVVWDMKSPPPEVLRNEQRLGARVIDRAAGDLAATFHVDGIVAGIRHALADSPVLAELHERMASAQHKAEDLFAGLHMPHLPTHEEIRERAQAMFAKTRSLDDIVDRAHRKILEAVSARLAAPA